MHHDHGGESRQRVSEQTHPGFSFARLVLPANVLFGLVGASGQSTPVILAVWAVGMVSIVGYFVRSDSLSPAAFFTAITGIPTTDDVSINRLQVGVASVCVLLILILISAPRA